MQKDLWTAYQKHGDLTARNRLVDEHLGLVYMLAKKMRSGLRMEMREMVSAGSCGLMDALRDFDRDKGLAFSTYAMPRIRGAILDEARRLDPMTRTQREKERAIVRARQSAEGRLGRQASPIEIAEEAGIDLETYWNWCQTVDESTPLPLDVQLPGESGRLSVERVVGSDPEVEERLSRESDIEHLKKLIPLLKEQERVVLTLYYKEGLLLREIGEVLGLTESRISQVLSKAVKQLRIMMDPPEQMAA